MRCISNTDFNLKKNRFFLLEYGSHCLYDILTWVTLFLLHFPLAVALDNLLMLKHPTNYGIHYFLNEVMQVNYNFDFY
jgi:hypothetical protein